MKDSVFKETKSENYLDILFAYTWYYVICEALLNNSGNAIWSKIYYSATNIIVQT